jgi:hypothetical protein
MGESSKVLVKFPPKKIFKKRKKKKKREIAMLHTTCFSHWAHVVDSHRPLIFFFVFFFCF